MMPTPATIAATSSAPLTRSRANGLWVQAIFTPSPHVPIGRWGEPHDQAARGGDAANLIFSYAVRRRDAGLPRRSHRPLAVAAGAQCGPAGFRDPPPAPGGRPP